MPETLQKDLTAVKKFNEKSKIIFAMETTSDLIQFEANPQTTKDGRTRT